MAANEQPAENHPDAQDGQVYVRVLAVSPVARTVEVADGVHLDLDAAGAVVGVEVLDGIVENATTVASDAAIFLLQQENARLRTEGVPGVIHGVDKAFLAVTDATLNFERHRGNSLTRDLAAAQRRIATLTGRLDDPFARLSAEAVIAAAGCERKSDDHEVWCGVHATTWPCRAGELTGALRELLGDRVEVEHV